MYNDTTLFDQHKKECLMLIEQLSGKPLTIITTGNEPTVYCQARNEYNFIKR